MIKIIHCIKTGPKRELGDFELSCIDSWKRVYPDWEIRYWFDDEILPLISDCRYAVSCYNNGQYAYAGDYARLKILYECGGLYMDTDVFAVERIPDACFEKSFTAWDAGFDTFWSQSGTCLYASEPHAKIIERFIKSYQELAEYPNVKVDNTYIEFVIRSLGIDYRNKMTCQFTNQDIGELVVYNCAQFGCFDYFQNIMCPISKVNPVYLVHARTGSWKGYNDKNVYLYYAFIDDNTDMIKLYNALYNFSNMKLGSTGSEAILVIGLNTISGVNNWVSRWLNLKLTDPNKKHFTVPLGNGLNEEELNAAFLDFITKRYNKIKFCRDILDGSFTGDLSV